MGGESVITTCKSGMTVDDVVIAAVREHGDTCTDVVLAGPWEVPARARSFAE